MIRDAVLSEKTGKPLMAVKIKLEPKGTPGGNPDITKPQVLVDKVEVIMQTLSRVRF